MNQVNAIKAAMAEIESKTCMRFKARTSEADYIGITGKDNGCFSYVGKIGGAQQVNLAPANPGSGCFIKGTIMHELTHAMGFHHMQSSSERDDWVTIVWNNIKESAKNNFNKYGTDKISNFGVQYDYGSIMHYPATAFSINGQKTILTKNPPNAAIGQRVAYSARDIARITAMYKC